MLSTHVYTDKVCIGQHRAKHYDIKLYDYNMLRVKIFVEHIYYEKRHRHALSTRQAGVERDEIIWSVVVQSM
jgi:hypothetical protein